MALTGASNEQKIWNYLYSKIGNSYGVAGLMGNLFAESGLKSNIVERLCLKRLNENGKVYTDDTYTKAVDDGTISKSEFLNPLPNKQYGYGLAQWTSPSRKDGLYTLAKRHKVSIGDTEVQLEFLVYELEYSYSSVFSILKNAKSVKDASDIVLKKFECPADTGSSVQGTRASYGEKYYKQYAKNEGLHNVLTVDAVIDYMIEIAKNEVGYLEKKSNSQLDDKTANAGSNNYTKYWRDIYPDYQAQAWCACFVTWVFTKAFGKEIASKLLKHYPYVYCPTLGSLFTKYANPQRGDIVIFYRNGEFAHTGIVTKVDGDRFWTIEGNTSDGSTIIANGGAVCAKSYYNSSLPGTKFCRPDYSIIKSLNSEQIVSTEKEETISSGNKKLNETVKSYGVVTAGSLNVRTWAGSSNPTCSFSPLKENTKVGICDSVKASDGSIWYFIECKGKYGFVHSMYISKSKSSSVSSSNKVDDAKSFNKSIAGNYRTTDNLNLRVGAGTDKSIICTIPNGGKITCYGYYTKINDTNWYLVMYGNYTGYVSSKYIKK